MPITLPPFDPSRDFVAQASFRAAGTIWARNAPFDKSVITERVLRQLYEGRKITYAPPRPKTPHFSKALARFSKTVRALTGQQAPAGGELSPEQAHSATIAVGQQNTPTSSDAAPQANEAEAAGAPAGDAATAAADIPKRTADELCDLYTRDQLLSIADGLELPSSATKPVIAGAIVEAGRADREPA